MLFRGPSVGFYYDLLYLSGNVLSLCFTTLARHSLWEINIMLLLLWISESALNLNIIKREGEG